MSVYRPGHPRRFELSRERSEHTHEGWVERIDRRVRGAELQLELADGSAARACVGHEDLELLELGEGQIVLVRELPLSA